MKRLTVLFLFCLLISVSCKKKETDTPPDQQTPFSYSSLTANPESIKVNAYTTLTADATGDGLTYTWECEFGTPLGSGSSVQWTVCHADTFWIKCTVADQYGHSESKTIDVICY